MAAANVDLSNCPSCYGKYKEFGNHLPRILPCSHSVCEKCIDEIIDYQQLQCPVCRKHHPAKNGTYSFPENTHILSHINALKALSKDLPPSYESLFPAKSTENISSRRLANPSITGPKPKYQPLLDAYDKCLAHIEKLKNNIEEAEKKVAIGYASCMEMLESDKERFGGDGFDGMLRDASKLMEIVSRNFAMDFALVDGFYRETKTFKENTNETTPVQQIRQYLQELQNMSFRSSSISGRHYQYYEYRPRGSCGYLQKMAVRLNVDGTKVLDLNPSEQKRAFDLQCQVLKHMETDWKAIFHICRLGSNLLVVCALHQGAWKLKQTDHELSGWSRQTILDCRPNGMTDVNLKGKLCLAMAFSKERKIEFYREKYITSVSEVKVKCSYPVRPNNPGEMCALPNKSGLLYLDKSKTPKQIRVTDCKSSTPTCIKTILTQHDTVSEMCCTEWGGVPFLIVAVKLGLCVYDLRTGDYKWSNFGKLPGMLDDMKPFGLAVNDKGYIFLGDTNSMCIYVFTIDGRFLGALLKEGEMGLGMPGCLRWCEKSSALLVTHFKNNTWNLMLLKVQK